MPTRQQEQDASTARMLAEITSPPSRAMPDEYDRIWGQLDGIGLRTQATTLDVTPPLGVGGTETFIIQTVRLQDEGDYIFLKMIGAGKSFRHVLRPAVTAVITRQRDALTQKSRRAGAKQAARTRKARGIVPDTSGLIRSRKKKGGRT